MLGELRWCDQLKHQAGLVRFCLESRLWVFRCQGCHDVVEADLVDGGFTRGSHRNPLGMKQRSQVVDGLGLMGATRPRPPCSEIVAKVQVPDVVIECGDGLLGEEPIPRS